MTDLASGATMATPAATGPVATPGGPLSYVHWGPVVAGALVAAAITFVLIAFGAAIGLAVASPSPTWRDASVGLSLLSGIWLLFATVLGFGVGAYITGRVRNGWAASEDEVHLRDGLHGLLTWALGIIIGALIAWAAVTSASSNAGTSVQRSAAEPSFVTFELDRLFRSDRRPEPVDAQTRAEAGRILMSGTGRREIATEDRAYLSRIVAARTGLVPPDADRRVATSVVEVDRAQKQARRSAVLLAFITAASLVVSAAVAWFAAGIGGHQRDNDIVPVTRASWDRRRTAGVMP